MYHSQSQIECICAQVPAVCKSLVNIRRTSKRAAHRTANTIRRVVNSYCENLLLWIINDSPICQVVNCRYFSFRCCAQAHCAQSTDRLVLFCLYLFIFFSLYRYHHECNATRTMTLNCIQNRKMRSYVLAMGAKAFVICFILMHFLVPSVQTISMSQAQHQIRNRS